MQFMIDKLQFIKLLKIPYDIMKYLKSLKFEE